MLIAFGIFCCLGATVFGVALVIAVIEERNVGAALFFATLLLFVGNAYMALSV